MKKLVFVIFIFSGVFVYADTTRNQKEYTYHARYNSSEQNVNKESVILLRDGTRLKGHLDYLPSLIYPFGKLAFKTDNIASISLTFEGKTPKMQYTTTNGQTFIGDLPREKFRLLAPDNSGQSKEVDPQDIKFVLLNKTKNLISNTNENLYSVDFKNGDKLPAEFNCRNLHLSDGWKAFTITPCQIIDVSFNGGLHGTIKNNETGQPEKLDLSFVGEKYVSFFIPQNESEVKVPWENISRIQINSENSITQPINTYSKRETTPEKPIRSVGVSSSKANKNTSKMPLPDYRPNEENDENEEWSVLLNQEPTIKPKAKNVELIAHPKKNKHLPVYPVAISKYEVTPQSINENDERDEEEYQETIADLYESDYHNYQNRANKEDKTRKEVAFNDLSDDTFGNNLNDDSLNDEWSGQSAAQSYERSNNEQPFNDYPSNSPRGNLNDPDDLADEFDMMIQQLDEPAQKYSRASAKPGKGKTIEIAQATVDSKPKAYAPRETRKETLNETQNLHKQKNIIFEEQQATSKPIFIYPEIVIVSPTDALVQDIAQAVISRENSEKPNLIVNLPGFYIDSGYVTNEQYQKFVQSTNRQAPAIWKNGSFPAGEDARPVVNISYKDAEAYAKWAGKRLPSSIEWDRAISGSPEFRNSLKNYKEWTTTTIAPSYVAKTDYVWSKYRPNKAIELEYRLVRGGQEGAVLLLQENNGNNDVSFRLITDKKD